MSRLPKIDKPLFQLLVPSTGKTISCRPFVVKEEKILLTAQQSGLEKDIVLAIKQVLNNCIQEPFDLESLTTFDLEYMFLKLRSRSVNNVVEVSYRDFEDEKIYKFNIDLEEVVMSNDTNASNKIMASDDIGLVMKYPSVSILENAPEDASPTEMVEYLVKSCIQSVFDSENVYVMSEHADEEIEDFIDSLSVETFSKIREFFDNIPKMQYKIEYTNSLGNARVIELNSLSDFFTWG